MRRSGSRFRDRNGGCNSVQYIQNINPAVSSSVGSNKQTHIQDIHTHTHTHLHTHTHTHTHPSTHTTTHTHIPTYIHTHTHTHTHATYKSGAVHPS